jgi:hypothetical protein
MTVRVMPTMILIGVTPAITAALLLQSLLPLAIFAYATGESISGELCA